MVLNDIPTDNVDYFTGIGGFPCLRVSFVRFSGFRSAILPCCFPIELSLTDALAVLLCCSYIFDWSVDPNVEDQFISPLRQLAGIFDTPVHISGDTPIFEFTHYPLAGLITGV
ncbi:hypothetical protein C487_18581 [Natrinema pallidum DSM 3751]|uniref:Uncharacterized protein n=1 Tax=Natrinema pallidum DSM 3751 TaxID=1227495 RepID=L9YIC1_9EURY|nr:hypothetical protein C487_18581 [Natrinema pallidum DSM 3751]